MNTIVRRGWQVALPAVLLAVAPAVGLLPTREELDRAHAWAQAKFAGTPATQLARVGLAVRWNHGALQANDVWMAWQFDLPEKGEGLIQVFRRAESSYRTADLRLSGLEAERKYRWNVSTFGQR